MIKLKLSDILAHLDDVKERNGSLSPLKGVTGTTPRGSNGCLVSGGIQDSPPGTNPPPLGHQNMCVCSKVCNKAVINRRGDGDTWGGGAPSSPLTFKSFSSSVLKMSDVTGKLANGMGG